MPELRVPQPRPWHGPWAESGRCGIAHTADIPAIQNRRPPRSYEIPAKSPCAWVWARIPRGPFHILVSRAIPQPNRLRAAEGRSSLRRSPTGRPTSKITYQTRDDKQSTLIIQAECMLMQYRKARIDKPTQQKDLPGL